MWGADRELVHDFSMLSQRKCSVGFSKNLSKGIVDGRTVAYAAMQLAYHLGFSKVFLVGFDLTPSVPRFYEDSTPIAERSPCALGFHFKNRILPSLQLMARKVIGKNFAVYNLSRTSAVPTSVIPFVEMNEVQALLRARDEGGFSAN